MKQDFAVVIVSCDKYSDLWIPFFKLFWRFWPHCPFNVYLLSNTLRITVPGVQNLFSGDDLSWSSSLRKGIIQLKEEYILLFLDDLFLCDFVKTNKVIEIFDWVSKTCPNYVRMNPSQKSDKPYNEFVGLVSPGTMYRTSTVLSLWRRDVLLNLLRDDESAWGFEIYGSIRSDCYDGFYSTYENFFPVINGVIKGKWQQSAVQKLESLGVDIDLARRGVMTFQEAILFYARLQRAKLINLLPARYRRKIKDFLLRGKYSYDIKA